MSGEIRNPNFEIRNKSEIRNPNFEIRNKSEIRNPKSETNAKPEIGSKTEVGNSKPVNLFPISCFGFVSDLGFCALNLFRISKFGFRISFLIVVLVCANCRVLPAGEMTMELDTAANIRLFDTHFARYGHATSKSITREAKGVRITLPAKKDVAQTGLYSYVVLAGDFEVAVNYEWLAVTSPNGGYGVSCGIAIDTGNPGIMVSLARANLPGKGQGDGYAVTVGTTPANGPTKYETTHFPFTAKNGRLMMRREQAELVCLVTESAKVPLRALCRLPFTEDTVHQVRVYADGGGSPTAVDVRLSQIQMRAEEITGGYPVRDQPRAIPWLLIVGGVSSVALVVLFFVRRRQKSQ
jgi:hypothetical protein